MLDRAPPRMDNALMCTIFRWKHCDFLIDKIVGTCKRLAASERLNRVVTSAGFPERLHTRSTTTATPIKRLCPSFLMSFHLQNDQTRLTPEARPFWRDASVVLTLTPASEPTKHPRRQTDARAILQNDENATDARHDANDAKTSLANHSSQH